MSPSIFISTRDHFLKVPHHIEQKKKKKSPFFIFSQKKKKKKNSTILKKNTTTYLILDIKNTTKSRRFEKNTTKFHFWITFVQKKHNKAIFWYG